MANIDIPLFTSHFILACASLLAMVSLGGCYPINDQIMVSRPLGAPPEPSMAAGPVYYLPKALFAVTIERKEVSETAAAGGAQPKEKAGAKAGAKSPGKQLDSIKKLETTMTVGSAQYVADTMQSYQLFYHPDALSSDTIDISVGPNGLLQGVNSTAKDETAGIVAKVGELAAEIAKAVVMFAERKPPQPDQRPFKITALVDPSEESCKTPIINSLRSLGLDLKCRSEQPAYHSDTASCDASICTRPEIPYRITLESTDNPGAPLVEYLVTAPNGAPVYGINLDRYDLVEGKIELGITNGVLTKYKNTKPSEVLAGMQIPIDIVKKIIEIPSDLLTLRIKEYTDEKTILDSKAGVLEKQASLYEQQADVIKKKLELLDQQEALRKREAGQGANP